MQSKLLFTAFPIVMLLTLAGTGKAQRIQEDMERHVAELVGAGEVRFTTDQARGRGPCPSGYGCGHEREGFFSVTNLALGAFQFGGAAFDTKTTMDVFSLEGTYRIIEDGRPVILTVAAFEVSGPEEPFIRKGTWALGGYKAAINVPIWVGSHYLRRSGNKLWVRIVGWTLPIAMGFVQWKAGLDNRGVYHDARAVIGY